MAAQGDRKDPYLKLIKRWRKGGSGREDAGGEISRRISSKLKTLFQKLRYWPEEVEDLKQETFQRVFQRIGTFKHRGQFSNWALRIARNVHHDNARKDFGGNRIPKAAIGPLPSLSCDIPTTEPSPEGMAISRETLRKVKNAMEQLPLKERRCLDLRVYGYEYEEIAMIMGIKESTCRAHIHNARKRLRGILGDLLPKDGF